REYQSRGVYLIGASGAQTLAGVDATTSTAAARAIYTPQIALTIQNGRLRGGQIGVDAANANVTLDHVVIADATSEGVAAVASTSGTYALTITHGTFVDNAYAVRVTRTSSASNNLSLRIDASIFAGNGAVVRDSGS